MRNQNAFVPIRLSILFFFFWLLPNSKGKWLQVVRTLIRMNIHEVKTNVREAEALWDRSNPTSTVIG